MTASLRARKLVAGAASAGLLAGVSVLGVSATANAVPAPSAAVTPLPRSLGPRPLELPREVVTGAGPLRGSGGIGTRSPSVRARRPGCGRGCPPPRL